MTDQKNINSPETVPESSLKSQAENPVLQGFNPGKKTEPPVYKLHASVELVAYIAADNPAEAKEKLKALKLGDKLNDSNITLLEVIPYEQYKDFKVEIIK